MTESKRILVTGGAGFIGSAFIKNHLKNNPQHKIVNIDNLGTGSNLKNLEEINKNSNYKFVKGDIRNEEIIKKISKDVDIIVNFAAESHVDRSISNPKPFIETNVLGTYTLLEAIRKNDGLLIQISTDEVYGDAEQKNSFVETDIINPSNPYSATKASADILVSSYQRTYGIQCIITRCTNNFGPNQFPEKLIPKTIIRATKGLKIPLHGGGNQIRNWIYVLDHVQAIDDLILKGKTGEIYNIGDSNEFSAKQIVEKILKLMNKPLDLMEDVADRPGQDQRYSLDFTKIQTLVGWKPKFDFEQGLEDTVLWYLHNAKWWEPLADNSILHPMSWTQKWSS